VANWVPAAVADPHTHTDARNFVEIIVFINGKHLKHAEEAAPCFCGRITISTPSPSPVNSRNNASRGYDARRPSNSGGNADGGTCSSAAVSSLDNGRC
jgi:hypothetical protein